MGTEVGHASNSIQTIVESPSSASASVSKTSLFNKKSGFVIPKNKLSGSMVPLFKGSKKGDGESLKEEACNTVQRKTKWGPDLTLDSTARKGRALAYQARINQISQLLTSRALEIEDNQGPLTTPEFKDGKPLYSELSQKDSEYLEFERREIIGELLKLNPGYKAPSDYKSLLKEANVPVPIKEFPGYNFIDLIFGSANDTQKRLEKETGAKIRVYGTKADKGGKFEVTPSDRNEIGSAYEAMYVHISADTFEKIDAAEALIELLFNPVSMTPLSSSTMSTTKSEDYVITGASQGMSSLFVVPAPTNNEKAQPYAGPLPQVDLPRFPQGWFPEGSAQASSFHDSRLIPTANTSASPLSNPVQPSSSNAPSYFGRPPIIPASFSPVPQNSSFVPSRFQTPNALQPQYRQQPLLPIQSGVIGNTPQAMFSDQSMPPTSVLPSQESNSAPSQNVVVSVVPQLNTINNMISPIPAPFQASGTPFGHPVASLPYNSASQLQRGHSPSLPPTASAQIPSAIHPSQIGPIHNAVPPPAVMRASSSNIMPGSAPSALVQQPGLHNYVSVAAAKIEAVKSISTVIPRPQLPISGDFTFQPHRPQSAAQVSWPSNQPPNHNLMPVIRTVQTPQPPLMRPLLHNLNPSQVHGFSGPQVYQNQPKAPNSMNVVMSPVAPLVPPRHLAMPGHNTMLPPTVQHLQQGNFTTPQLIGSSTGGPHPPRGANQNNLIRQNHFPGASPQRIQGPHQPFGMYPGRPLSGGIQQVYDPFSPTSVPFNPQIRGNAAKPPGESDPEYEDLMASVGVK